MSITNFGKHSFMNFCNDSHIFGGVREHKIGQVDMNSEIIVSKLCRR